MFNKSSLNKFTDFIQSIYNMMTGSDLTTFGLGFLVYTSYVELVNDFISEYNPIVEEIIQRRDELWSEYIVSPKFRVWGGKPMITLILVFGVGNALVHILSSFNLLPVYQ